MSTTKWERREQKKNREKEKIPQHGRGTERLKEITEQNKIKKRKPSK